MAVKTELKNYSGLDSLHVVSLNSSEQDELQALATNVSGDPYSDFESFYDSVSMNRNAVPERVKTELENFRDRERAGALLIKGLPLGNLVPPTPTEPFAKQPILTLRTETYLVMLATIVADPFSFCEWDAGHMVHNKYPIKSHREVQFGSNAVEFLVHTETPFREFSPDYIALLCVRGDPTGQAQTRLGDVGAIIESLSEAERDILREPLFAFETDNPAIQLRGKSYTAPMPIILDRDGETIFEYVHDLCAISAEGDEVLAKLKERVANSVSDIFLDTAELIIIDNSHMVHGRSAYEPRYDGTDRWLQRLLLTSRLYSRRSASEGRLVSDKRLEHYTTAYRNVLQGLNP
jgi:L-asparagine oxygenase